MTYLGAKKWVRLIIIIGEAFFLILGKIEIFSLSKTSVRPLPNWSILEESKERRGDGQRDKRKREREKNTRSYNGGWLKRHQNKNGRSAEAMA